VHLGEEACAGAVEGLAVGKLGEQFGAGPNETTSP
jgi:hypothetical protein